MTRLRAVATLHTQRFTLRPLRRSDAAALLPTLSDPVQCRYLTHAAFASEEELWRWLADPHWPGRSWIAEDATCTVAGRFVAIPGHEKGVEEIGYIVCADRQREGVARECAAALVEHLIEGGARKITADVDVENPASIRLIERLGFTREGTFREHEATHEGLRDLHRYGLIAHEWSPPAQSDT